MYRTWFGSEASAASTEVSLAGMTGGLLRPDVTFSGPNLTIGSVPFVSLGNESGVITRKQGTFQGGPYSLIWPGGASQAITYVGIIADHANGTAYITEKQFYRGFSAQEMENMCAYLSIVRNVETGDITQAFRFCTGPFFNSLAEKIEHFLLGPRSLQPNEYRFGIELSPFGGSAGCYFSMGSAAAVTGGRNSINDEKQTYVINDTAVQGASPRAAMSVGGRSSTGNEGQLLHRTTGSSARVLSGQAPMYEPSPALIANDYINLAANQYVAYRLVVFPGTLVVVMQPNNVVSNSLNAAISEAHVYETPPFSTFDRYLPVLHAGYFACKGDFNPLASWATNAGKYKFFDKNRIEYAG